NSACKAGSARLTTLPSINARLDPRIVAAKIQGLSEAAHGARAGEERITPSAHGCTIEFVVTWCNSLSECSQKPHSGDSLLATGFQPVEVESTERKVA